MNEFELSDRKNELDDLATRKAEILKMVGDLVSEYPEYAAENAEDAKHMISDVLEDVFANSDRIEHEVAEAEMIEGAKEERELHAWGRSIQGFN